MHPQRTLPDAHAFVRALPFALLAASFGVGLGGCDSPACIFGGDCLEGGGGGGGGGGDTTTNVAFPVDGEWVLAGNPTIVDTFPKQNASPTSPVVIVFSESLNPQTALDGFVVERADGMPSGGGPATALVGDGRVLIIFPSLPLAPATQYVIRFDEDAEVTDLTGEPVTQPVDGEIATFSTIAVPANQPALVMSYPAANASSQSELGEIITVFDRQLDDVTVNAESFVVGLSDQVLEPPTAPEPLLVEDLGSFQDTRVYRWRYLDAEGDPQPLPVGARVVVRMSPAGGPAITDETDAALPETTFQFDLAPYAVPSSGSLASEPDDAIGIEHLVGMNPLMMLVEFGQPTQEGDRLDVLVFGIRPDGGQIPSNIAFERVIELPAGETEVLVERDQLALVTSANPLVAIVEDGDIGFAYRYRRGNNASPVRLLDTLPLVEGIQDAQLDTVAPQLVGFGVTGVDQAEFRSDFLDLALVGRANEALRSVEVTATLKGGEELSNGALPETSGAEASGLFVAAAIDGAGFPPGGPLTADLHVRLYDKALNQSPAIEALYHRTGSVALSPSATELFVHAYDASTKEPVSGARCFLHVRTQQGPFGLPDVELLDMGATDANGQATLLVDTMRLNSVTVDADGFDLFTLQGVTGGTLTAPLEPTAGAQGLAQLNVTASGEDAAMYVSEAADSRFAPPSGPLLTGETCSLNPFTNEVTCVFLPWSVHVGRTGALAWFATDPPVNVALFVPENYLRSFAFGYPLPALVDAEVVQTTNFDVPTLLADDPDPAEHAVATPSHLFDRTDVPGQSSVSIPPAVRVETVSPGVAGRVVVGLGLTFDMNNDLVYDVRAAFPGAVDPFVADAEDTQGRLVQQGAVADHLYLVVESLDPSGSATAVRTRLTGSAPAGALVPIGVPVLEEPVGTIDDPSFTAVFTAVLPSASAGLYSAILTEQPLDPEQPGRAWRLYRLKPAGEDLEAVSMHFPPIAAAGGMPLSEAALVLELGAITSDSFAVDDFHWVELAREATLDARSGPNFLVRVP